MFACLAALIAFDDGSTLERQFQYSNGTGIALDNELSYAAMSRQNEDFLNFHLSDFEMELAMNVMIRLLHKSFGSTPINANDLKLSEETLRFLTS